LFTAANNYGHNIWDNLLFIIQALDPRIKLVDRSLEGDPEVSLINPNYPYVGGWYAIPISGFHYLPSLLHILLNEYLFSNLTGLGFEPATLRKKSNTTRPPHFNHHGI